MIVRLALLLGGVALAATAALPAPPAPAGPTAAIPAPAASSARAGARAAAAVQYRLPVDGPVARLFDPPAARWSAGHRGLDLVAEPGAPVRSPGDGTVVFSGVVVDRTVLTVRHPDGLRSSLEPLADPLPRGATVHAGDVVGSLAVPGAAPGGTGTAAHCGPTACVHWGVRRADVYVDPLGLLEPAPVVLLPDP